MSALQELFEARNLIRCTYAALRASGLKSPEVADVISELDRVCVGITDKVERIQPSLFAPQLPMRVSGGVR